MARRLNGKWRFGATLLVAFGMLAPTPGLADGISLSLGFGGQVRPTYSGSDSYDVSPWGYFSLHEIEWGPISRGDVGPRELREGFTFGGAVRPVRGRSADDNPELAGLADVDFSIEAGLRAQYGTGDWRVFGDLRYGVIGHESVVAELGGDAIFHAGPDTYITLGPRLLFGSDAYADTYYGITAAEALASSFAAYDPQGGLVSAGLQMNVIHELNEDWSLRGRLEVSELVGDAADSPIVQGGTTTQMRAGVTIVRRFNLGR